MLKAALSVACAEFAGHWALARGWTRMSADKNVLKRVQLDAHLPIDARRSCDRVRQCREDAEGLLSTILRALLALRNESRTRTLRDSEPSIAQSSPRISAEALGSRRCRF